MPELQNAVRCAKRRLRKGNPGMSDYLTAHELGDLVGCKPNRRAAMKAWLEKSAWPFVKDRNGMPKVLVRQ
jgi:hypothetical protein